MIHTLTMDIIKQLAFLSYYERTKKTLLREQQSIYQKKQEVEAKNYQTEKEAFIKQYHDKLLQDLKYAQNSVKWHIENSAMHISKLLIPIYLLILFLIFLFIVFSFFHYVLGWKVNHIDFNDSLFHSSIHVGTMVFLSFCLMGAFLYFINERVGDTPKQGLSWLLGKCTKKFDYLTMWKNKVKTVQNDLTTYEGRAEKEWEKQQSEQEYLHVQKHELSIIETKQCQIQTDFDSLQSMYQTLEPYIEIPHAYRSLEITQSLMTLMLNKRASTIQELINLYEELKFRSQLICSVNHTTNAIQSMHQRVDTQMNMIRQEIRTVNDTIAQSAQTIVDRMNDININLDVSIESSVKISHETN